MIVPVAAQSFDEALCIAAEVHAAAGRLLDEAGRLRGVADEGGWWPAFERNEEALEWLERAIERAGQVPGDGVAIALDVAASQLREGDGYRLRLDGRSLDTDGLCEQLRGWIERHPIVSVEDPLDEGDHAGMRRFTAAVGERVQVVGDDYLVTDAERVARAAAERACTAVLVKPNQAGTVSGARRALRAAREAGLGSIVSARSGETEDTTIVHLAVGWDAGQLKVGSFQRSERMAKWNEALRIEEALGADARFAGSAALRFRART
jgi:enolase